MREFGFTWTELRTMKLWQVNALVDHLEQEARREDPGTVRRRR